ncbi:BMP family lipoprotein [Gulosibacter molinativorax]|uniref:BMP family ABC transporter substrate-binding protein n=1 Tax=Gulosibacter molinativorax TaxID=256821 RepID=A0ABT7C816_9MICO|nr:BMP family ABC transporter substrate-binding protein [Gulosibacter molinativorax]MDJ1371350.1 BMP family ABC transporter substrate-binding protein [Gulosibacter molinativorax]QUY63586.1 Membrane lipoprotein TmpC [Gulosibacter molinativorax]
MPKRNRLIPFIGIAAVGALALSACGQAPDSPESTGGAAGDGATDASDFTACMVSDEGGFDDKSFNQLAHKGLTDAEEKLGINTLEAESTSPDDFNPNLQTMVDSGCNIIIPVGFMLADATQAAADANPDTNFAIVDVDYLQGDNLLQINYDTAQAAFLAGYAAAGYSEAGTVATYGGAQIPSVTIFMDGFADGVAYHNEQKGTDVKVLGWNVESQTGEFVGNFTDNTKAKQITEGFLAQGADVILPVGGPLYQGGAEAIRADGNSAVLLGVDSDLTVGEPGYSDIIFVSILKGLDVTVLDAIETAVNGEFAGGTVYTGTLENNGVGLSGFGEFESKLPDGMLEELDTIKEGIISGDIVVESPSSPKAAE